MAMNDSSLTFLILKRVAWNVGIYREAVGAARVFAFFRQRVTDRITLAHIRAGALLITVERTAPIRAILKAITTNLADPTRAGYTLVSFGDTDAA
jgi:hypothetical protein